MEIPKIFVGAPAAVELNVDGVDVGTKQGCSATGTKRSCRYIHGVERKTEFEDCSSESFGEECGCDVSWAVVEKVGIDGCSGGSGRCPEGDNSADKSSNGTDRWIA